MILERFSDLWFYLNILTLRFRRLKYTAMDFCSSESLDPEEISSRNPTPMMDFMLSFLAYSYDSIFLITDLEEERNM